MTAAGGTTADDGTTADGAASDGTGGAGGVELISMVDRLSGRVAHWTPARWKVRADPMHALVQQIADLAATNEGESRREVPRLDNDLALCDQLRVVVADLVAAQPPPTVVAEATELVRRVDQAL